MKQLHTLVFIFTCLQASSLMGAASAGADSAVIKTRSSICSVGATSDGKYLVVGHGFSRLVMYDAETQEKQGEYDCQAAFTSDDPIEFSIGDSECVATRSGNFAVTITQKDGGHILATWDPATAAAQNTELCKSDGVTVTKTTEGAEIAHGGKKARIAHVRAAFVLARQKKLAVGTSTGDLTLYPLDALPVDES